jgi:hypothetical protein
MRRQKLWGTIPGQELSDRCHLYAGHTCRDQATEYRYTKVNTEKPLVPHSRMLPTVFMLIIDCYGFFKKGNTLAQKHPES